MTSSANTSVYGQSVTFTATVKAASPGSGTPTGTVTFYDGTTDLGNGTLSAGTATFSTTFVVVGSHSITAVYSGDTNFTTSTSSALTQTVNQAATTTAVVSAVNPSIYGQPLTFTATVSANLAGERDADWHDHVLPGIDGPRHGDAQRRDRQPHHVAAAGCRQRHDQGVL